MSVIKPGNYRSFNDIVNLTSRNKLNRKIKDDEELTEILRIIYSQILEKVNIGENYVCNSTISIRLTQLRDLIAFLNNEGFEVNAQFNDLSGDPLKYFSGDTSKYDYKTVKLEISWRLSE